MQFLQFFNRVCRVKSKLKWKAWSHSFTILCCKFLQLDIIIMPQWLTEMPNAVHKNKLGIIRKKILFYIFFNDLTLSQTSPGFYVSAKTSPLKTLQEKEKLLSFIHSVFYLHVEYSAIFLKFEIVVCKHFVFGRV